MTTKYELSTGMVADLLGVPPYRLGYLLRERKIRPNKGPTGAFTWTHTNICEAADCLKLPLPSDQEIINFRLSGFKGGPK